MIYLFSIWHILKQHVGISKLYDYVLSQRRNDRDISRDMRWVYLFYISAFVSCYVYVLSRPNFKHTIASPWLVELMHPPISTGFAEVCMSLSGIFFLLACYRIIYVRAWKKKLFFPIPQLLVLAGSLLQVVTFILVLPPSAWILLWLAPPLGHQIQYFGYSWLYLEKSREISQPKIRIIDLVTRRGPVVFYLIFVGLSALIYSLGLLGLALVIALTIQLLSTAHYLIDGLIWKKNLNSDVKPVSFKLTGAPL